MDLLEIEAGQHVLEIGSGSGWLAAIMGYLVGAAGTVTGIEIIDSLAKQSVDDLRALKIENVRIRSGNALEDDGETILYDRVVITAGSRDVPEIVVRRTTEGGLILLPKTISGTESKVILFRKTAEGLDTIFEGKGYFVPLVPIDGSPQ